MLGPKKPHSKPPKQGSTILKFLFTEPYTASYSGQLMTVLAGHCIYVRFFYKFFDGASGV